MVTVYLKEALEKSLIWIEGKPVQVIVSVHERNLLILEKYSLFKI